MSRNYGKLVRDNIPEIIISNGEVPITRILDNQEYKVELEKKLFEEYNEVLGATTKEEKVEELADMLGVISALADSAESSIEEVLEVAKIKCLKRGGFKKRIYLEKVEEK